jgi:hypothetical protein
MTAYGVSVTIKGTTYNYIIDTKAQVRELLLGCTAPISEVIVMKERRGFEHEMMTAEELLELVLNHPEATAEVEEEVVVLATTSA